MVIGGDAGDNVRVGKNEESVDTSSEGSMEKAPQIKRVTVHKSRQGCVENTKTS
jgi:hypothetical protein